jgi:hypothetical protein
VIFSVAAASALGKPITVQTGELAGPTDRLGEFRLRNFNNTISDYEMMINADPTGTVGQNQTNGHVPGAYAFADWARDNTFVITYNAASGGKLSFWLVGSGPTLSNPSATGQAYDVRISRVPDTVTAGPVNYIKFQLWDREPFSSFTSLQMTSLDGQNLGNFSIPAAGIGTWSFLDKQRTGVLNDGFTLTGTFSLDMTKVANGREGDKLIWVVGYNKGDVPVIIPLPAAAWMGMALLTSVGGVSFLRKRPQQA